MLTITSDDSAFALELANETRWSGIKIAGGAVSGIHGMDVGILPEEYWVAAESATYAVYHYGTPIVWQIGDGSWQVPNHRYSTTTSQFRSKILRALESNGATVRWI